VTRFFADKLVERFQPVLVARSLSLILGAGVALVTWASSPWMALCGLALMGVGTSAVFPLAMSAAAQRSDRPAAVNVAALAQTAFVVFLLGPPLLGWVAEFFGIRAAFAFSLPLIALSFWAAKSLKT
jgi:MFS family permease